MAHRSTSEAVALYGTGEAVTAAGSGDIYEVTLFKYINTDDITGFVIAGSCLTDLADELDGLYAGLFKLTLQRLVYFVLFNIAETDLYSIVAVAFYGLIADDDVVAGLDDRYRDELAFLGKDLGHAQLSA